MLPKQPHSPEVVVNAPEAEEALRAMCADHGDYYADALKLEAEVGPLYAAGADPETILAERGDAVRPVLVRQAANIQLFEEATRGPVQAMISKRKTGEVNMRATQFADALQEELGPDVPIDTASAEKHVLFFAAGIAKGFAARHARTGATKAASQLESATVNQFGNELIARMNPDTLCDKLILPPNGQTVDEHVLRLAQVYRPLLETLAEGYIHPEFIAGKLLTYRYNIYLAAAFSETIKGTTEVDMTPEQISGIRHNNDVLAGQLQRLGKYRASELVFPFDDIIAGTDLVTHDSSDVHYNLSGEQPLALTRIVPTELEGADKVALPKQELSAALTKSTIMRLSKGEFPMIIDSKGELRLGMSINENSISLRTFFETRDMSDQYEVLRETILSAIFDATLTAKIVDKIVADDVQEMQKEVAAERAQQDEEDGPGVPNDVPAPKRVLGRLALPRIRYMQDKSMGQLGKEIQQALAAEEEETKKAYKLKDKHYVPGFERDLPKGAKGPSKRAIELAREYHKDPNYELPPGKTWVDGHYRGLQGKDEIVGHVVTGWASPQAKRTSSSGSNKSKKRRKK